MTTLIDEVYRHARLTADAAAYEHMSHAQLVMGGIVIGACLQRGTAAQLIQLMFDVVDDAEALASTRAIAAEIDRAARRDN